MPKWRAVLFGLKYTRDALKALQANEPKKVRRQIKERIDALAQEPNPQGAFHHVVSVRADYQSVTDTDVAWKIEVRNL